MNMGGGLYPTGSDLHGRAWFGQGVLWGGFPDQNTLITAPRSHIKGNEVTLRVELEQKTFQKSRHTIRTGVYVYIYIHMYRKASSYWVGWITPQAGRNQI